MVRFFAMLFIVLGFAFGGGCIASFHTKRVSLLNDIVFMLSVAETQLRYACIPVNDLLNIFNENNRLKSLIFIKECRERVTSGEAFPPAWNESIQNQKELCFLIRDVLPYLIQFGEDLGSTDLDGQLNCCEYYKQIFLKELAEREEQSKKHSKLFPVLGVMLGISAVIILV